MKKKLLFTAYSLDLGGIETALINLLKRMDYSKYEVDLILEKKEGIFLPDVPKTVNVYEYKISSSKFVPYRKVYNRLKLIKWKHRLRKNKYSFSCSYATSSIPGALLALSASKKSCLWVHNNYHITYPNDIDLRNFFDGLHAYQFNKVVFVSRENMIDVCDHYSSIKEKALVCNNFIDGDNIISLAKEKVSDFKKITTTFINVGRHDENQKRLSRIIDASKKLKSEGFDFQVLFVGDGQDTNKYKEMIEEYNLEDTIIMLGRKKNPYPYYKLSDAVLLSSDYEGYPVVFLETLIMNKVLLSTKVSDWKDLDKIYGKFSNKTPNGVYNMMKDYLKDGFKPTKVFDYIEYNKDIENKLYNIINY